MLLSFIIYVVKDRAYLIKFQNKSVMIREFHVIHVIFFQQQ